MLKPRRVFFGIVVLFIFLAALPLSASVFIKGSFYSLVKAPVTFSKAVAQTAVDLFFFGRNAKENRALKRTAALTRFDQFKLEEISRENVRLTQLLDLRRTLPADVRRLVFARVIARSPAAWSRVFLIDKGSRQGVKENMLAMSDSALVGKVVETGPVVSKVLLITDPNSKIGALIQRTRQAGILFGTSQGECRMKYISVNTALKQGDLVETAGFGGFFPKGLIVGIVRRAWKEPGQIYQVAEVSPLADLSRLEEVALVE